MSFSILHFSARVALAARRRRKAGLATPWIPPIGELELHLESCTGTVFSSSSLWPQLEIFLPCWSDLAVMISVETSLVCHPMKPWSSTIPVLFRKTSWYVKRRITYRGNSSNYYVGPWTDSETHLINIICRSTADCTWPQTSSVSMRTSSAGRLLSQSGGGRWAFNKKKQTFQWFWVCECVVK